MLRWHHRPVGRPTPLKRSHGFSLIEVLAAMVIFSTGAVVLFDWINQTAVRLGRLSQEQHRLFGDLIGLEYARTLNPMLSPTGEIVIDEVRINWQSAPVGEEIPVRAGVADGRYMVQLYKVELSTQAPKASTSSQSLYLTGWRERAQSGPRSPFGQPLDVKPDANAPR